MNIFEGARRITAIAAPACAIIVGFSIYKDYENPDAYYVKPYDLNYEVESPHAPPKRISDCHSNTDELEVIRRKTQSGKPYRVSLCFKALESSDGRLLVPFKIEGDKFLMNERFSTDVSRYTKLVAHDFKPTVAEMQEAEDFFATARRSNRIEVAAAIVGIPLFFWILAWAIGWTVRGFLGIPRGQDHRPVARRDSVGPDAPL